MILFIQVLLLLLFPTISSVVIHVLLHHLQKEKKRWIPIGIFYFIQFFTAISGLKVLVGYRSKAIFSSFDVVSFHTLAHYSVPYIIIIVCFSIIFKFLLPKKLVNGCIQVFNSIFIVLICCRGVVTNQVTVVIYIFSLVTVIIMLAFRKIPLEIEILTVSEVKKRIVFLAPVLCMCVITAIVYIPFTLYMKNVVELKFPFSFFLQVIFISSLFVVLVYSFFMVLGTTQKVFEYGTVGIFAINLCGYIQNNFLNGQMRSMDGVLQTWSLLRVVCNIFIWLGIIGVTFYCFKRYNQVVKKLLPILAISLCIMQLSSMAVFLLTDDLAGKSKQTFYVSQDNMLELHPTNNVIVFVLDWFDEKILENIEKEEEAFLSPFSDFMWYQNASSRYLFTGQSIPYLLTGVEWIQGMGNAEYVEYAFENPRYLRLLKNNNVEMDIYTDSTLIGDGAVEYISNIKTELDGRFDFSDSIMTWLKCSQYSMAPFLLKNIFAYGTQELSDLNSIKDRFPTVNDYDFSRYVFENGLTLDETNGDKYGSFHFYHLTGAHAPYKFTEDLELLPVGVFTSRISQSKGALKIVFEFIRQMKELGIYDDSTIIITADHGQNIYFHKEAEAEEEGLTSISNPILLVKKPNQIQNSIGKSSAPVSHNEFMPTVLEAFGVSLEEEENSFDNIRENLIRERRCTYGRIPDIPFEEYVIRGDARDIQNWYSYEGENEK